MWAYDWKKDVSNEKKTTQVADDVININEHSILCYRDNNICVKKPGMF